MEIRVAVLSDIHANASAFRTALHDARRCGFDRMIILGDLLTYGCEPNEVISLTAEAVAKDNATLILGNHDQLYFDMTQGRRAYYDRLPEWVRESADWTFACMKGADLENLFAWRQSYEVGKIIFAHANPHEYGDWSYLNSTPQWDRAAETLRAKRMSWGVFGHTHRIGTRTYRAAGMSRLEPVFDKGVIEFDGMVTVATVGSVGQPRDHLKQSTWSVLRSAANGVALEAMPIAYDVPSHRSKIHASALTGATKTKLLGFFP